MDTWISFIRITLALATGLFGALGLLTKYRDDSGKITKWGRIALGGILLSSSFSVILYALEASKSKAAADKARAEANATAQLLKNILTEGQTTADQQKRTLDETNVLKQGLKETLEQQRLNLRRSDYIAKGMERSLVTQQTVLTGNERILGGVTTAIEKQAEVLTQTTTTLHSTQRLLQPIGELKVGFQIGIAPSRNTSAYLKHLREEMKRAEDLFLKTGESDAGRGIRVTPSGEKAIVSITINAGSPILAADNSLTGFLKLVPFYLSFYRASVTPKMWEDSGLDLTPDPKLVGRGGILVQDFGPVPGPTPDLRLHVFATDSESKADSFTRSKASDLGFGQLITIYDKRTDSFSLHGMSPKASIVGDNGRITSVLDLPGLTMVVEFLNRHAELLLWSMDIEVARGKRIVIRPRTLKKQVIRGREYYFYTIRPEDIVLGP